MQTPSGWIWRSWPPPNWSPHCPPRPVTGA